MPKWHLRPIQEATPGSNPDTPTMKKTDFVSVFFIVGVFAWAFYRLYAINSADLTLDK
jgi:hypothetical protein